MKKEWLAVLLLLLILTGNVWNQRHAKQVTDRLLTLTEAAHRAAEEERWDAAADAAERAEREWRQAETYTSVFIRHAETDALTDAICGLRGAVAGRDAGEILGAVLAVEAHIRCIREMEQLSFGTVF